MAEYFHIQLNKKRVNVFFSIINTKRVPFFIHAMRIHLVENSPAEFSTTFYVRIHNTRY
jgi:hypothetical protein